MSSREGKSKAKGVNSQPSNSGAKGTTAKTAATSAPVSNSNGNSARGAKGTNTNSNTNNTQNSTTPSVNPNTNNQSTPTTTTTASWSSIAKPNPPKTVNVDLTKANSAPKQTSAVTQNSKESSANSTINQPSTNSTNAPNTSATSISANSSSNQKVIQEDTTQKTIKTESENKPQEKDKVPSIPPVKSTQPSPSGASSTTEQGVKGNSQPIAQPNSIPANSNSTSLSSANTAPNFNVKAPVFRPGTNNSSSVTSNTAPFPRTHSAPPSLEEQQKAYPGITEQSPQQPIPPPVYFIPQKTYYPPTYYPPAPGAMNYPRLYPTAPLFVPSMQVPPISANNQPTPSNISNPPIATPAPTPILPPSNLPQSTPALPPTPPRRNVIPIIDPKTGKEVTSESPPKQRPKSNTLSSPVTATPSVANPVPSNAPSTPTTSTPTTVPSSANNVGVQPLTNNSTNQSGNSSSTSQKSSTTAGPGGILPELGSMNASQAKDKGVSTTTSANSNPPTSSSNTSSDKAVIHPVVAPTPVNPVTSSVVQETTPIVESKPEKKKKMKDILKKAEEGEYKAASFDPYVLNEDKKPVTPVTPVPSVSKSSEDKKQETEEDSWENKDEKDLVNLKNKQTTITNAPSSTTTTSDLSSTSIPAVNYSYKKVINYSPGMWSPDNTKGKLIYDRNFMLQFQDMEYCREKPKEMADMDELMSLSADDNVPGTPKDSREKDKQWSSRQSGNYGSSKGMKRTESNNNLSGSKGGSSANTPSSTPTSQRRDNNNNNRNAPQRRTDSKKKLRSSTSGISSPLPPDVAPLATSENRWEPSRNKALSEEERVHRKVTSILNKLTEETYAKLSEKLLKVEIKTVDILKDIIKIVFDKAIWEPKFVKMYAEICNQLSKVSPEFTVDEKVHNFKRLLLNRCQEEFESAFKGSKNIKDKENEVEEAAPATEDTPSKTPAQDEMEVRAKKQMMGNVGFIGELFKAGMLTEKIMHDCLSLLLGDIKSPSDIHIEALCRLMASIGAEIDHQKAKKWMDQYFARMKELAKNPALPSRIRFMLEDSILMRENNWLTRKDVQKEVESKAPPPSKQTSTIRIAPRGSLNPSNSNTKESRTNRYEEDDWEVVGKGKREDKTRTPSSSKPQEDLALRPQTFGPMNSLGKGAKGWSTKSSSSNLDSKTTKESSTKSTQSASSSTTTTSIPEKELSIEEVETKMDDILEEFFSSNDTNEASICIKELKSPSAHVSIVTKGIMVGLEKKEKERKAIASLFSTLYSTTYFTSDVYVKGITGVLDTLEDLSIDIPQAPSYVAFFIAHGLFAGYLSKSHISTFVTLLGGEEKSSKVNDASQFIADIIYYCSNIMGDERKAREIIENNELKSSLFKILSVKSPSDSDSFNLKFIIDKKISRILPIDSVDLMLKLNHSISKIKTWIEEELGEQTLSDAKINRGITRSILSRSFVRSVSDDKQRENFKQNAEILKLFLERNVDQQIQTLFEIQSFQSSNSLPKGTSEKIFEILFDLRLVSGKAFTLWEKSNDDLMPENNKNKAETVKQVESFLQKIKSNPQLDDELIEGEDGGEEDDQEENPED